MQTDSLEEQKHHFEHVAVLHFVAAQNSAAASRRHQGKGKDAPFSASCRRRGACTVSGCPHARYLVRNAKKKKVRVSLLVHLPPSPRQIRKPRK